MKQDIQITDKQKEFMKLAIELAEKNVLNEKGGPFGAVVVKDGEIISAETNSVTGTNDPTAHAEINAIRKACKQLNTFDLSGCEIYSSCEPCPMCLSAVYWARISVVYFAADKHDAANAGFDDSFIYSELSKSQNEKSIKINQINLSEAQDPFKQWGQSNSKIKY